MMSLSTLSDESLKSSTNAQVLTDQNLTPSLPVRPTGQFLDRLPFSSRNPYNSLITASIGTHSSFKRFFDGSSTSSNHSTDDDESGFVTGNHNSEQNPKCGVTNREAPRAVFVRPGEGRRCELVIDAHEMDGIRIEGSCEGSLVDGSEDEHKGRKL